MLNSWSRCSRTLYSSHWSPCCLIWPKSITLYRLLIDSLKTTWRLLRSDTEFVIPMLENPIKLALITLLPNMAKIDHNVSIIDRFIKDCLTTVPIWCWIRDADAREPYIARIDHLVPLYGQNRSLLIDYWSISWWNIDLWPSRISFLESAWKTTSISIVWANFIFRPITAIRQ